MVEKAEMSITSEEHAVGVTTDFKYVTVNVPEGETEQGARIPGYVMLLLPKQAYQFARLLETAADSCVVHGAE